MASLLRTYATSILAALSVGACGFNIVKATVALGEVPILRPLGILATVAPDGQTFSVRVAILNQGIKDAPGPFDVKVTVNGPVHDGSGNVTYIEKTETLTIPSTTIVPGTYAVPSGGGAIVTGVVVSSFPWTHGESYNFDVEVDPNGKYFGGVAKDLQTFAANLPVLGSCAKYGSPCQLP